MKLIVLLTLIISNTAFGQYAKVNGPNCLNTALLFNKIVPFPRYTSNTEFDVILKSKLCHKVKPAERKTGDISYIIGTQRHAVKGIYSHAYVFLRDDVMYEKIGYGQSEPYRMVKESEIHEDYSVGELARFETSRCRPLKKSDVSAKAGVLIKKFEKLEEELFDVIDNEAQADKEIVIEKIKKEIPQIVRQLKSLTEEDQFGRKLILSRIVSVSHQLRVLDDSDLWNVTKAWELSSENLLDLESLLQ